MPTQNIIPVTPGSGLDLDAVSLTIGLNTVYRETMVIADPSNATYLATVTPGGALNVAEATLDGCITANVLAVSLPSAQITTLTPPTAAAIAAAIVANPPTVAVSGTVGVTQSTTPWIVAGGGTAGTAATGVVTVQGIAAMTPLLVTATFAAPQHVIVDSGTLTTVSTVTAVTSITNPVAVTGTFFQATQPVSIASGQVASGAFASGSIASGAIASGAIASGAIAAGAAAAGAFADGSVFVRSNAAATFPVTAIGTLTHNNAAPAATNVGALVAIANAVAPTQTEGDQVLLSTALTGSLRVGTKTNNSAAPAASANVGSLGAVANATSPLWTEGNQVLVSVDLNGGQRTISGNIPETTAAWTSATAGNTASTMTVTGYNTVVVFFNNTATITAGAVTFEVSDTGTNWAAIIGAPTITTVNPVNGSGTLTLGAGISAYVINVAGFQSFRVRLSTVISGTGTVNVGLQASAGIDPPNIVKSQISSPNNSGVVADNILNAIQLVGPNGNAAVLTVGDEVYGGAFSGSASAAKQGWNKARTSTVFNTASVAATTTGNSAVWTPATGNKFRLLAFQITAQGLAATATGVVTVSFQDGASGITFGTYDVDVPAVAGVTSGVDQISGWVDIGKFGILSAAANNVLNFNISAAGAGTVGTYRVNVAGTEE